MPSPELRQDIATARLRGKSTGGKRELYRLQEYLRPGEQVEDLTTAAYERRGSDGWWTFNYRRGLLVLTDRRLFYIKRHLLGRTLEDFPFRTLHGIAFQQGVVTGKITVLRSPHDKTNFSIVDNADGKRIVDQVRTRQS